MQVTRNVLNVSDVYTRFKNGSMIVNRAYQRGPKLWPATARSYFIDTILNGYPFPKITIRQIVDTHDLSTKQEIVDGQQRIGTIVDFLEGNLRLSSTSKRFAGLTFDELDDDAKQEFLAYEISVDTIIRANDEEVLETFRRMNAYMLPLNKPELRYSQHQGCFKWYISDLVESYSPFFQEAGILTIKDIGRMRDAELLTECTQAILDGVLNKSEKALDLLYSSYDESFDSVTECKVRVSSCIDYVKDQMGVLYRDKALTGYMFYSLFSALQYNKYGPANDSDAIDGMVHTGKYCDDPVSANQAIMEMIGEIELRREQRRLKEPVDNSTKFAEFAVACESSTHRQAQRLIRRRYILRALQGQYE